MIDARRVADGYRRHVSRGRARVAELTGGLVEVSSSGSTVVDSEGREYLDCGGYGVFLLGHRHPAVVSAVVDQVQRHPLSTRLMLDPTVARAATTLASVTPEGLDLVHFVNSGAEATEAAIKLARASGRRTLSSASGGFHGKTTGALGLTANDLYQAPFRPLLDVLHVPFGNAAALAEVLSEDGGPDAPGAPIAHVTDEGRQGLAGVEDVVQEQDVAAGDVGGERRVEGQVAGGGRGPLVAAGLQQRHAQG